MRVIRDVICSKCGKKQIREKEELLQGDLFWRVCEFCHQYGLVAVTRQKLTLREWMEASFNTVAVRIAQTEALIKDLSKEPPRF